jgi:hypothetical protein
MDARRFAELSEMAEASEDVALQLASEVALSGAHDVDARLEDADAFADAVLGRRAFQEDEAAPKADLASLAEDAGF